MANKQKTAKEGKTLGRYRIEKELGRGGMGVVYLAIDENLGRRVALKTTSIASIGSSEQARSQRQARFIREVKALAQVNHENVVHVFDAAEADDPELGWLLFYTMQFVDGITLAQMVHRMGALEPGAAASVCMQVAAGLGAAHKRGIVHRDVKPANIFIDKAGRALIGDFGICKLEGSTQITRRDQLVGTPNYLAPEQILGEDITPATDVFALAALFFVIATNRPLRERVDPASLLREAQTNDPHKKMLAQKHVPEGLRKVVARALERDPTKRFADCREFADALSDYATRIPAFDSPTNDNMERPRGDVPAGLDTGTSPFAPLPGRAPLDDDTPIGDPPGEDTPEPFEFAGAGAAGVEEAALALLKDAGISDDKIKAKKAAAKKAEVEKPRGDLPVARVESTVMFNLRQMEDEEKKKRDAAVADDDEEEAPLLEPTSSGGKDLPVARVESTVMFNLRKLEDEENQRRAPVHDVAPDAPPDLSSDPVSDPGIAAAAGAAPPAWDNPALTEPTASGELDDNGAPVVQPAVKKVGTADVARAVTSRPSMDSRTLIMAAGGGGIVLAITLLVLLRAAFSGDDPPPVEAPPVPSKLSVLEAPPGCEGKPRNARAQAKARDHMEKAYVAFSLDDFKRSREQLDDSLKLDPTNVRSRILLGRHLAREGKAAEAIEAYRCVIYLDATSPEADTARRAIETAEATAQ